MGSEMCIRDRVNAAAVKRLIAGLTPHSSSTSAYCQARSRLPLSMIERLTRHTGELVAEGAAAWWLWRNRRVRLVDGATMTLADTPENQAKYPQPNSQKTGLGFPICRMVALLCLATGALLDASTGPCAACSTPSSGARFWSQMLITPRIFCSANWSAAASMGYSSSTVHASAVPTFVLGNALGYVTTASS